MSKKQRPKKNGIEVITLPNVLKARVGGGSALDLAAISRAESAITGLSGEFEAWMSHDIEALAVARSEYEKAPGATTFANLYRTAHDLKGQANSFNSPMVARIATSLCALVDGSETGEGLPVVLINAHVDAIKIILQLKILDAKDPKASLLAAELEAKVIALRAKHP